MINKINKVNILSGKYIIPARRNNRSKADGKLSDIIVLISKSSRHVFLMNHFGDKEDIGSSLHGWGIVNGNLTDFYAVYISCDIHEFDNIFLNVNMFDFIILLLSFLYFVEIVNKGKIWNIYPTFYLLLFPIKFCS
jgi:hypothetical protein